MKKIIVVILSSLLVALAMFYYSARNAPTRIIPYPYIMKTTPPEDVDSAKNANILLIGDRIGNSFNRFSNELIQELSSNIKGQLRWYNWAKDGEGLHRTLAKLKFLPKWPKVIVYIGGSEEGDEKKFKIEEYSKIMLNFKLFSNPKIATLLMTMPDISKVIYSHPEYVTIEDQKSKKEESNFQQGFEELEFLKLTFKLYESELRELHTLAREHESTLIILTAPINLEVAPKRTCSDMITTTTMTEEVRIQEFFDRGDYKTAFNALMPIVEAIPGNAKLQFMLGKAAQESGQLTLAKDSFYRASAFDCELWRAHPVLNQINRSLAQEFGQTLVDFDALVNGQFGKDTLFLNDIFAQDVYFKLASNILKEKLKKILNL